MTRGNIRREWHGVRVLETNLQRSDGIEKEANIENKRQSRFMAIKQNHLLLDLFRDSDNMECLVE